MTDLRLTPEQEAEAQLLYQRLLSTFEQEALQVARLMASKDTRHLLGQTEFQLRDRLLQLGSKVLQAALDERKKGGTKVPAPAAPSATNPPAASASGNAG
jgi:hypothetical protein